MDRLLAAEGFGYDPIDGVGQTRSGFPESIGGIA
jgi:hypothetical protein